MTTATNTAAAPTVTAPVNVRGHLTTAPKTTYSNIEAGWVEISWDGGSMRKQIFVCDGGRSVSDYWWGHTFPTILSDGLPRPLWSKVVDFIKERQGRVGAFEATIEVAGLAAPHLAAAA
jgi:hypothetical protein